MTFLVSMPGGAEWVIVLFILIILLIMPLLAILFFVKMNGLRKELDAAKKENKELLEKLLEKNAS
ncbi:MAG: hypothetical protein GC180_02235 [Bacteroidetes bacterium]|nr:hypothetical protein [Bacteroidota bacterium]